MKFELRKAKKEDYMELQALFDAVHSVRPSMEYLVWKFDNNPAGATIRVVADAAGKIVGQCVLWPTNLQLGKEIVRGTQRMDSAIHPDYQGQGLFTKLTEMCMNTAAENGIEVFYAFPNKKSYQLSIGRLNWDHVGDIPMWVRPIKPSVHSKISRIIGSLADIGAIILPSGKKSRSITITSSKFIPSEREMEPLLKMRQDTKKCRISRSYDWLKWRFSEESGLDYEWLSAYRDGRLTGYMVWAVKVTNATGIISDIIANDQTTLESLLFAVVKRSKSKKCSLLTTVTNIQPIIKALRNSGFIKYRKIPLIVREITTRMFDGNIHDFHSWEIMGCDLDTY